jgi:hypothetical protein
MSIKRAIHIVLVASAVMLAVGAVPGSAARSQPSDLSAASAAAHRLGSEMRLSPSPECDSDDQLGPAVAYNPTHKEYLVAWTNMWGGQYVFDIYARRVSESGQVLEWFCVATGLNPGGDGKNRTMPSVAYNAANDEYLVVWEYWAGSGVYEVRGRRIPWDGPGSNPEFLIFTWPNRSFYAPCAAWNSARNEYLVIWNAMDTSTWQSTDIAGCRVSADGVVQPGAPIIITTSSEPRQADLIYSAALDGYMVAWTRSGTTTSDDVYGAFLDPDGAKITPPGEFPIYEGPGDQWEPAVASNEENRYMVVWDSDHDIYGQVFRANGDPFTAPFALAGTADYEASPDVAANATGQYLAVWTRPATIGSVVARLYNSDGTLAAPVDVFAAPSWDAEDAAPAVACDVPGCLIAYSRDDTLPEPAHIYGRLYWPQAVYLPLVLRNSP